MNLTVFFTLLGFASVKAVHRMLMKLSLEQKLLICPKSLIVFVMLFSLMKTTFECVKTPLELNFFGHHEIRVVHNWFKV